MSSPHPARTVHLLVLALVLGVLSVVPAAAAEFDALGCYNDPAGDAGAGDEADLLAVCINFDDAVTHVEIRHASGFDPQNDPAWNNDDTAVSVLFSTDDDDTTDVQITFRRTGGNFVVERSDGAGNPLADCPSPQVTLVGPAQIDFDINVSCFDGAEAVRGAAVYSYEPVEGQAVAMDRAPDTLSAPPLPQGDASPFCDNRATSEGEVEITRLRCGGLITGTEPITQAVAVSQFVFDDLQTPVIEPYLGRYAVIVRNDNFADALAGSSLGFGQGPLLFAYSPTSGPALDPPQDPTRLPTATRQELLRTVPRGFRVYVLGGTAAIDEGVMDHLRELGYEAVRIAGPTRVDTAAAAAREVRRQAQLFSQLNPGFPDTNMVLVANQDNWPDAVLGGQIGAFWGFPILLTSVDSVPQATLDVLDEIRPNAIQIIGGSGVVSSPTLRSIRDHAVNNGYGTGGPDGAVVDDTTTPWRQFCGVRNAEGTLTEGYWVCRQGGRTRIETGAAVSQFGREMIQRFGGNEFAPDTEVFASGVPLGGGVDSDNYAYVLAASMMSGRFGGAVFLPTDNDQLSDVIKFSVCDLRRGKDTNGDGTLDTPFIELVELVAIMTDTDKLSDSYAGEIRTLIEGGCPPEFTGTPPAFASAD